MTTRPEPTMPKGYQWVGTISHQYGAWLCYWGDGDSEEHTAHGSLDGAKRYLRSEVFGNVPLRYEVLSDVQVHVYAKGVKDE